MIYLKLDDDDSQKIIINLLIFASIQLRNLSALFATTLFSLYTMYRHPEDAYPKFFEGKLEALDFETMLTSSMSIQRFFEFIEDYAIFYRPYMQIYMRTKMFSESLDEASKGKISSIDHENLRQQQEAILKIVETHQVTHFNFDYIFRPPSQNTPLIVRRGVSDAPSEGVEPPIFGVVNESVSP